MSSNNNSISLGHLIISLLLCAALWLGADFHSEYRKNNMTEAEKAELVLTQKKDSLIKERQEKENQLLLSKKFSEVESSDKPRWIVQQTINSVVARFVIALFLIGAFGFWYIRRDN